MPVRSDLAAVPPDGLPFGKILAPLVEAERAGFRELGGARVLVSGGTGFVGRWLVEAALVAASAGSGPGRLVVLTRDPDGFRAAEPALAAAVELRAGDVGTWRAAPGDRFDAVIHAASASSHLVGRERPYTLAAGLAEGMLRMIDAAVATAAERFLLVSSGAVYGRQPPDLDRIPESFAGAPDPLAAGSEYAEGKRACELLAAAATRELGLRATVARLFAFADARLPLDRNFAVGNFVADVVRGGPLVVLGDGTPMRSYMTGADLAVWLWAILARGAAGAAYNVGSPDAISVAELAALVSAEGIPRPAVEIRGVPVPGRLTERYVPDVSRAERELGLSRREEPLAGIRRMVVHARAARGAAERLS